MIVLKIKGTVGPIRRSLNKVLNDHADVANASSIFIVNLRTGVLVLIGDPGFAGIIATRTFQYLPQFDERPIQDHYSIERID